MRAMAEKEVGALRVACRAEEGCVTDEERLTTAAMSDRTFTTRAARCEYESWSAALP